jgi:hypothetical protein
VRITARLTEGIVSVYDQLRLCESSLSVSKLQKSENRAERLTGYDICVDERMSSSSRSLCGS